MSILEIISLIVALLLIAAGAFVMYSDRLGKTSGDDSSTDGLVMVSDASLDRKTDDTPKAEDSIPVSLEEARWESIITNPEDHLLGMEPIHEEEPEPEETHEEEASQDTEPSAPEDGTDAPEAPHQDGDTAVNDRNTENGEEDDDTGDPSEHPLELFDDSNY